MTLTTSAEPRSPAGPSRLDLRRLRAAVRGPVLEPDHPRFADAIRAWNLNADHRPALAVLPADTDDVAAAVGWATAAGLGVAVQATGHGTGRPCGGGLLLNTSGLRGVTVQPDARRVRVRAGNVWTDVLPAAGRHGLAALPGSSTTVGVVGYTLGGGFGWLGRRYGLAAHTVRSAELVTADGRVRRVTPEGHPDLFWGLPGGATGLGVVTALEFALHPLQTVYGGNLYYPHERLAELLAWFAEWSRRVPDELTAAVTVRRFPPAPNVPEPLRGRVRVALRGCYAGDPVAGAALIDQARTALGPAAVDAFGPLPPQRLAEVSSDPVDPLPVRTRHELLTDLTAAAIDELVGLAGPDAAWPLVMTEVRQLGAALPGPAHALSPMAHTRARFSLNAVGMTPTPAQDEAVRRHLAEFAHRMGRHATGDTYLNFLDLEGATPDRLAAAFTPDDRARLTRLHALYDPTDTFRFGRRFTPSS